MYDLASDKMRLLRAIFWDEDQFRAPNLHSTMQRTQTQRYFFQDEMRFSNILENCLVGLDQSRVTQLSTTFAQLKQKTNDFLRSIFAFEQDDLFNYERMSGKIINLQIRLHVLREVYLIFQTNCFPFEPLAQPSDLPQRLEQWFARLNQTMGAE